MRVQWRAETDLSPSTAWGTTPSGKGGHGLVCQLSAISQDLRDMKQHLGVNRTSGVSAANFSCNLLKFPNSRPLCKSCSMCEDLAKSQKAPRNKGDSAPPRESCTFLNFIKLHPEKWSPPKRPRSLSNCHETKYRHTPILGVMSCVQVATQVSSSGLAYPEWRDQSLGIC